MTVGLLTLRRVHLPWYYCGAHPSIGKMNGLKGVDLLAYSVALAGKSIGKMNGLMGVDLLAYSVDLAG